MIVNWQNVKSFLYDSKFVILLYVIGDWTTTAYALPIGMEYNSIPAIILDKSGILGLLVIKLLFLVLLYWCYMRWVKSANVRMKHWNATKHFIELVGLFAVVNNLMVIFYGNSLIQVMGLV